MDINDYENEQVVDFGSVKKRIIEFKSQKKFQENIYLDIINELDACYDYRAKKLFQKWSKKMKF